MIWNMFTRILMSVQKYLSTKYQSVSAEFRARPVLLPALLFTLPLLVLLIFVILPAFTFYTESSTESGISRNLALNNSFYLTQLEKVKADSIGMTVNLRDSVVILDVKGVALRQCRIEKFALQYDHLTNTDSLAGDILKPFTLQYGWGSTAKIPIMVKNAPKDTAEANQELYQPVRPPKKDIFVYLQFDKDFLLYLKQNEPVGMKGWLNRRQVHFRYYAHEWQRAFNQLLHGRRIQPGNKLEIILNQDDALAVYRALPKHGQLSLYLP